MDLSAREKFQALLRELFEFDCADLDFGIYRIMNYKRQVIEKWIAEDLPRAISAELKSGALAEQAQAQEALQAARQKVLEALGEDALDHDGNLAEKYRETKAGKEVFLLRNLSRGYGIGLFEERGFYPDFILWVVDQNSRAQRIVFIEPHGMLHAKAYIHDEKARLHERLPELAKEVGKRSGRTDISLDAFIISATPYDDLYQRYDDGTWDRAKFAEKHILFGERGPTYDYMRILFGQKIVSSA